MIIDLTIPRYTYWKGGKKIDRSFVCIFFSRKISSGNYIVYAGESRASLFFSSTRMEEIIFADCVQMGRKFFAFQLRCRAKSSSSSFSLLQLLIIEVKKLSRRGSRMPPAKVSALSLEVFFRRRERRHAVAFLRTMSLVLERDGL